MANHFVIFWVAAALWLVIITSANPGTLITDDLASSGEAKELDEDRIDIWLNGGHNYGPVNQPDPESDDDISKVLEPVSQPDDLGTKIDTVSEKEELDKLFYQFRMLHFRMKTLNETTVYLEWTIMNATNGLDSNRLLNISTISKFKTELISMNQRVAMSKEICHKYSDLLGKCNFTITVNSCSNYQFRLGGERNTELVTTVGVDPPSLREELSEMGNSPIKLRWKITCDSDFMIPVFVTLADMKTSMPKHEKLNATCENRTCVATTEKLRTSPCSKYSLSIEGGDLRIVNTPPTTKNLSAEAIPWKNQYLLRWFITPVNCPFDPVLMVAKTNSLEKPVYNKLVLNASPSDFCIKGFCEYLYEVEPCVTHWIKSSNPNTTPLKLQRPRVLGLSTVYSGNLNNPVRLSWKVECLLDETNFSIALTDGTTQQRNLSQVNATCDDDSQQCSAYLTNNGLLPCNRYEVEIEGSNEIITFETPPPPTVSIRPLQSGYNTNGTLVISVAFEGIQRICGTWKNSIELQFLDLPSKAVLLPCSNNNDGIRKNCTVVIQLDPPDFVCYPVHNIAIRPVYSRSDVNASLYRGSWLNTTITPLKPESWGDNEKVADLVVKANASQQSMRVEWRNPICFRGLATYPTNLTIVSSGTKEPLEYHVTIASQCSRSNSDPSKSSITVQNGEITCFDGNKLSDNIIELFKLTPCTNYSVSVKPVTFGHPEPLSENSAMQTTFITEFIHLQLENLSPANVNVSASHSTGSEWELKLGVQKKYCPCDDHIVSATFKIPSARLIEQTVSCNKSINCRGKVEFNHLNLCRMLAVNFGLQYSKSYTNQIFWFNKTLLPLVEENKNNNETSRLQAKEIGRHTLQLKWKDPVCLNGVVSFWNVEFRQENGSLFRILNIPYNCSDTNSSSELTKVHNVYLEGGQVVCEKNWKNYDIGLAPCKDYSVTVMPVVEGQSPSQLLEFSQSGNFTSLFNPSNVADVKIFDVTSNNFELSWSIPSRCLNSYEIDVEVNGTILSIKPSDNTSDSNIVCDEIACRMTRSINPSEMILVPCSDYTVHVGATNLTLTTFPGDNELMISPNKTSVTAAIDNKNNLNIEMTFHTFDERCSARLVAIEFQLPDVFPSIQHVLLCGLNATNNRDPSSTICSTQITIKRMDKCEALTFNFRPLYEDISYADKVSWVHMKLNPFLNQAQRKEKKLTVPEIKVDNSDMRQTVLLNWNDPTCLLVDSLAWEVRINSTTDDIHRIRFPSECSLYENGTFFERSVRLENGHLLQCNSSYNNYKKEKVFTFMSCSSYLVSVIPAHEVGDMELTTLEEYAQSTLLRIPLVVSNPNVTNVTSNTFSLEWSFPLECLNYVEMGEMSTTVELNGIETEINPLSLTLECDEMKCTRLWTSPDNLTSCTEYTVTAGSAIQKILTLPDSYQSHTTCDSFEETSVQKATAFPDTLTSITLIICLSMFGSVLLGVIVGIGFGIHKRKLESGKLDIKKRSNARPKALSVSADSCISGVAF